MDIKQIDELIEKLGCLKTSFKAIDECIEHERYLTTKDIARMLGVSEPAAREYMNRPDFPRIDVGKGYKVSATAFFLYNLQQRV